LRGLLSTAEITLEYQAMDPRCPPLRQIKAPSRPTYDGLPAPIVEWTMQPIDQAVTAFVVTVFVIFSVIMGYATWLGPVENKKDVKK
jgi:hypothetical protein